MDDDIKQILNDMDELYTKYEQNHKDRTLLHALLIETIFEGVAPEIRDKYDEIDKKVGFWPIDNK